MGLSLAIGLAYFNTSHEEMLRKLADLDITDQSYPVMIARVSGAMDLRRLPQALAIALIKWEEVGLSEDFILTCFPSE